MLICLSKQRKFATNSPISFIFLLNDKAQENLKVNGKLADSR